MAAAGCRIVPRKIKDLVRSNAPRGSRRQPSCAKMAAALRHGQSIEKMSQMRRAAPVRTVHYKRLGRE